MRAKLSHADLDLGISEKLTAQRGRETLIEVTGALSSHNHPAKERIIDGSVFANCKASAQFVLIKNLNLDGITTPQDVGIILCPHLSAEDKEEKAGD
jgi:hypothetical protein